MRLTKYEAYCGGGCRITTASDITLSTLYPRLFRVSAQAAINFRLPSVTAIQPIKSMPPLGGIQLLIFLAAESIAGMNILTFGGTILTTMSTVSGNAKLRLVLVDAAISASGLWIVEKS
jgi:hypothetical protein